MNTILHKILTYIIAVVWFINGLFCKVLGWVPRHERIVGKILGEEVSEPITLLIGFAEIVMAVWVVSQIHSKWNAMLQIIVIATMNALEFFLAPELLLWGRWNMFFALVFIGIIYCNEFVLKSKIQKTIAS